MTSIRFSPIDLAGLAPPAVIQTLDVEGIISARKADIVARLRDIDEELADEIAAILTLESEPMTKLQESGAYRETLHYARVNDAARAVLLATSFGTNLDNLGAFYKVVRMDGENDERFKHRISIAPEALTTCGSAGAYIFQTMSVDTSIKSVGLHRDGEATVHVSILVDDTEDGTPSTELLDRVRSHLDDELIKPLTDDVVVGGPQIEAFAVVQHLHIGSGPDRETVRAASEMAVRAYLDKRHRTGVPVYVSALDAAAVVAGVEKVTRTAPVADILPGPTSAAWAQNVSVTIAA